MPSDADAIRALSDEWVAAANEGDLDRWIDVFAEDANFMAPDVPMVVGKQAIYDWAKESFFDVFDMHLDNAIVELDISDDWACGRFTSSFTGTPKDGGDTIKAIAKGLALFEKQSDGTWKWASNVFNWDSPLGS